MAAFLTEVARCCKVLEVEVPRMISEPLEDAFRDFLYFESVLVRKDKHNGHTRTSGAELEGITALDPYVFEFVAAISTTEFVRRD
jgi:hypothetical protein